MEYVPGGQKFRGQLPALMKKGNAENRGARVETRDRPARARRLVREIRHVERDRQSP